MEYQFIDSGAGNKLERFGAYILLRPCGQAVWQPQEREAVWRNAHATFSRQGGKGWSGVAPTSWNIEVEGITFKVSPTEFGHLGLFPEQRPFWRWVRETVTAFGNARLLNLFAYSGGITLAAAQGGAQVCHLDASKGMVAWARENGALNSLGDAPIRWIVDDVRKFLKREISRGRRYDAIVLDPPTFGRGAQGELFKIEEHLPEILEQCCELLSDTPLFVLLSCHTPGFTPMTLQHLMRQSFGGESEVGEMLLTGDGATLPLPSGTYARWMP